MNPEELLNQVAILIEERGEKCSNRYHICFWDGQFRCLPSTHAIKPHPVFLIATDKDLTDGLTNHQWDNLLHKLTVYQKAKT